MKMITDDIFAIDWTDLQVVKELADKMGRGTLVVKHDGRDNYNILPAGRVVKHSYKIIYTVTKS